MICSALRTVMGLPSDSSTWAYLENTPIPGPMALWARSTGAMLLLCSFCRAGRSSRRNSAIRLRRVVLGASAGRLRQTSTMEEARAFVPCATDLPGLSVRIGHVPVIVKPARMIAVNIVSQPVEAVLLSLPLSSVSLCL